MCTGIPASSSRRATPSTVSSLWLVKIWRMGSVLGGHGGGRATVGDHADEALLRGAGHQPALAVEDLAAGQAARGLAAGAVERVQQPVVGAERAMEPERVVQRGHLHVGRVIADAVREGGGAQQVE